MEKYVNPHGFFYDGLGFQTPDVLGADVTEAYGLNDAGAIVGWYESGGISRGFLINGGIFSNIDILGAEATFATDINNQGYIAGYFQDDLGFYHGFVIVPVPPGLVLLGSGLVGLVVMRGRKR